MIIKTTKLLFLLILLAFVSTEKTLAQGLPIEMASEIEKVKADFDGYLWGDACMDNQIAATQVATELILGQISVKVSSEYKRSSKLQEKTDVEDYDYEETVENVLQTYVSGALSNFDEIKYPLDDCFYVFRYIERSEIDKIFDFRKQLVKDIFDKAERYEADGNYAAALKYYYFSSVLLNSVPVSRVEHNGMALEIEIGSRLSDIISNTRFEVINDEMISDKKREITLSIVVNGEPAKALDFEFWDGSNQIFSKSIDGTALITLYGSSVSFSELQMRVKYKYYENRNEIKEVGELWSLVSAANISNRQKVKLEVSRNVENDTPVTLSSYGLASVTPENIQLKFTNDIGEELENVEAEALNTEELKEVVPNHLESLEGYFNEDLNVSEWNSDEFLSDKLDRLKRFNKIELSKISSRQNINNTYEGWEFRQMSGNAYYKSLNMQSKEYMIPDFDSTGKMVDLNFGILDDLYDNFRRASTFGDDWDKRQVIIKFVEKYRTAYLTRDMDQLDVMFSDEAVIIVGRVLKKDEMDSNSYELDATDKPDVEYLKFTKSEFLTRQSSIFQSQADIHLGFTTFDIRKKNGQDGVYGVSMRQNYTSSTYADEGYLFLLVDFNGIEPKIYVRAWQPQEWDDDALIDLADYTVKF